MDDAAARGRAVARMYAADSVRRALGNAPDPEAARIVLQDTARGLDGNMFALAMVRDLQVMIYTLVTEWSPPTGWTKEEAWSLILAGLAHIDGTGPQGTG